MPLSSLYHTQKFGTFQKAQSIQHTRNPAFCTDLVSVLRLLKFENLFVYYWFDVVGLDTTIHLDKLCSAAYEHTSNGADVHETVQEAGWFRFFTSAKEADDRYYTL